MPSGEKSALYDDDMSTYNCPSHRSCLCSSSVAWLKRTGCGHSLYVIAMRSYAMNSHFPVNTFSSNFLHMVKARGWP